MTMCTSPVRLRVKAPDPLAYRHKPTQLVNHRLTKPLERGPAQTAFVLALPSVNPILRSSKNAASSRYRHRARSCPAENGTTRLAHRP